MSAGLYLGVVGMAICAVAMAGGACSFLALRGQAAGVALSVACLALWVVGAAAVLSGALVAAGGVR